MQVIAVVVGVVLVLSVLADALNTLVTTQTSSGRYWLTRVLYTRTWSMVRVAGRAMSSDRRRERFYGVFAPVSVIALLMAWVLQQIVGFGLIWWGIGGVGGATGLGDALYFSGVVYFTLGFGEIVPVDAVPRVGALVEAFSGVLTIALVIGYLPALYSAYSEREQKLLMLDDGTEDRITPTSLVLARCPDGDPRSLDAFFADWEAWVAQVMETHTTFPMLVLFRSQNVGQSWITGLGVVTDAALHLEFVEGSQGRAPYWLIRRCIRLLQQLTDGHDVSAYRAQFDADVASGDDTLFRELYETLRSRGFPVLPYEEARRHSLDLRARYAPNLEYLIDLLDAPRGFWGHAVGHRLERSASRDLGS